MAKSNGTRIYYKGWGTGPPVVFSHGWPLSADAWDDQMVREGITMLVVATSVRENGRQVTTKQRHRPARKQELLTVVQNGVVESWRHVNLHGEDDVSDEKREDSIG